MLRRLHVKDIYESFASDYVHAVALRVVEEIVGVADAGNVGDSLAGLRIEHQEACRRPDAHEQPMTTFVEKATAPMRFSVLLIGIFAAIAVLMAAVGLYGVLSTVVRQRTAELAMRMILGAPSGQIFSLVVGEGLRLSAVGVVAGLIVAFGVTRLMTKLLVGVTPSDPSTFGAITVLFFVIATIASWMPARRAAALAPNEAIREE